MKGFIELTRRNGGKISFPINSFAFEDEAVYFNGICHQVNETYEEIKQLIKQVTQPT